MFFKNVDPHTLKEWLDADEAVLIDVREKGEYDLERIPNSHLIPLGVICGNNLPQNEITINNKKKIVVHCRMGKRGAQACEILLQENPQLEIYNLEGGISAWVNASLPVVSGKS